MNADPANDTTEAYDECSMAIVQIRACLDLLECAGKAPDGPRKDTLVAAASMMKEHVDVISEAAKVLLEGTRA